MQILKFQTAFVLSFSFLYGYSETHNSGFFENHVAAHASGNVEWTLHFFKVIVRVGSPGFLALAEKDTSFSVTERIQLLERESRRAIDFPLNLSRRTSVRIKKLLVTIEKRVQFV